MARRVLLALGALLAIGSAQAAEPAACDDQGIGFLNLGATELMQIADRCEDPRLRSLYRRRAEHQQIVNSFRILAKLRMGPQARYGTDPNAALIHMALVEVLAPQWFPEVGDRIEFLNDEYERRIRVADLRLRGHDLAAARLEREFTTQD